MPRENFSLVVAKVTPARGASANKAITVSVVCRRRAVIYAAELAAAQASFRSMCTGGAAPVDARLRYALSGERLEGLLASLADLLDDYVAFGVAEDFQPGGIGAPGAVASYNAYFAQHIDAGAGVPGFFGRYPLLQSAVTTLRGYFVDNIALACARVTADWAEIERAFVDPAHGEQLRALVKFTPTGSDFHKHGKQVIILTFAYTTPNPPAVAAWRRRTSRGERSAIARRTTNVLAQRPYLCKVVYKPTDIEIDCRIMGDVARLNLARGGAGAGLHPEQPQITQSLMELFNARLGHAAGAPQALPTYCILPHNPGSAIAANPPGAAILNAYGYIEFLTHEPRLEASAAHPYNEGGAGGLVAAACAGIPHWRALDCMDWVAQTTAIADECFRHWGRLAAIAVVLSIADMHVQNVIVHRSKPTLIDLEDSAKWRMTGLAQTGMFGAPATSCDNLRGPNPQLNGKVNDKSQGLMCGKYNGPPDYSGTVLFQHPAGGALARVQKGAQKVQLDAGFDEIFTLLANGPDNAAVDNWVALNLAGVITRFVAMPTEDYYDSLCAFIVGGIAQAPPAALGGAGLPAYVAQFEDYAHTWLFEKAVRGRRDLWCQIDRRGNLPEDEELRQWRGGFLPTFALDYPTSNWKDIIAWDIPSFYRRLSTTDLLSSVGAAVVPVTALQWQNARLVSYEAANAANPNAAVPFCHAPAAQERERLAYAAALGAVAGPANAAAQATAAALNVSAVPAAQVAAQGPALAAANLAAAAGGATGATVALAAAQAAALAAGPVAAPAPVDELAARTAALEAVMGAPHAVNQATAAAHSVTFVPAAQAAALNPATIAAQAAAAAPLADARAVGHAAARAAALAMDMTRYFANEDAAYAAALVTVAGPANAAAQSAAAAAQVSSAPAAQLAAQAPALAAANLAAAALGATGVTVADAAVDAAVTAAGGVPHSNPQRLAARIAALEAVAGAANGPVQGAAAAAHVSGVAAAQAAANGPAVAAATAAAVAGTALVVARAGARAAADAAAWTRLQHYFAEDSVTMVRRQITSLLHANYRNPFAARCKASMP